MVHVPWPITLPELSPISWKMPPAWMVGQAGHCFFLQEVNDNAASIRTAIHVRMLFEKNVLCVILLF